MTQPSPRPTAAEVYERAFVPGMFAPLSRVVLEAAGPRPGESVLDLACGTGVVARQVAPIVGGDGRVVALDLRPGMLAVARSLAPPAGTDIEWLEGDATAMDLPDASFDLVICQQALQFFEPRDAALREVRRVLRPAGRFVAAVWRGIEEQPLLHALSIVEMRHLEPMGLTWEDLVVPFRFGDPDEIRRSVEAAGFADVDVRTATIETDYVAETFVADVEYGYAAVVPEFMENPDAHAAFVEAVEREAGDAIDRYRDGDRIRAPMSTNVVSGTAPG